MARLEFTPGLLAAWKRAFDDAKAEVEAEDAVVESFDTVPAKGPRVDSIVVRGRTPEGRLVFAERRVARVVKVRPPEPKGRSEEEPAPERAKRGSDDE